MSYRAQIDERGVITRYKDTETGEVISAQEYDHRMQMHQTGFGTSMPGLVHPGYSAQPQFAPVGQQAYPVAPHGSPYAMPQHQMGGMPMAAGQPQAGMAPMPQQPMMMPQGGNNPLIQPGAQMLAPTGGQSLIAAGQGLGQPQAQGQGQGSMPPAMQGQVPGHSPLNSVTQAMVPTAGQAIQGKNLRMDGMPGHAGAQPTAGYKNHGFLDATSIAILLPTLVLLALVIAAAHKKRLFPWQTIRTFNPPSGMMTPRDYERSYLCPPNLRRHGRLGKRNPKATWTEADGVVIPFGFLARTHLPVTIPMGRLPNKNMFLVAPSGSGKTTLMRAVIKALLAKPCVIIALEAKANDPNLDEKREGFKYSVLPEAEHAGFNSLYFNPLDSNSVHWNPMDLSPIMFASSIVQDVNSLPPEEQHWAERDHGYICGLAQLLKWGSVQVSGEDENGQPADVQPLPCNPRGLMRLVNNRRNIVESLRRMKNNPDIDAGELSEMTQTLSSIIRTDSDWDKNIQGVRGRLRMFKNPNILRVTEQSNIDMQACMHQPTVLIFGAPASLGPDAESLASCFVYQLQQALHTRYGTKSVLPLFAFFDEYQTLNIDLAGRLSAIVRGANGGLTVILQNINQITGKGGSGADPAGQGAGGAELKTIFSNSAIRVCLHNADETTARFFSEEIGKHAVIVPGISDHYQANGFGIFPTSWNRIHSQQVVARVDPDSIKRMEKHHALVYLSPAGDPEFGETKPIMVDLRGIEEIARLHLLHNVTARRANEEEITEPQPEMPYDGADIASYNNNIDYGVPAYQDSMESGAYPPAQPPAPPFPYGQPEHAVAAYAEPAAQSQASNGQNGRSCQHCGKAAGKGKFCIECGQFIGASAAQPAPVELSTQAQVIQPVQGYATAPPFAQPVAQPSFTDTANKLAGDNIGFNPYAVQMPENNPAGGSVIRGAQRQPMTSFHIDPARLGELNKQAQPGQGGVEF